MKRAGVTVLLILAALCQACRHPRVAPADELCTAITRLTAVADSNFVPVRGKQISQGKVSQYDAKVILPESFNDNIQYQNDVSPSFFASLYRGRDSSQAFHRYIDFSDSFLRCGPGWKIGDKRKFEDLGDRIYSIFVHGDVVVYVVFEKKNKIAFTWVMITLDPDNPEYDKIHSQK